MKELTYDEASRRYNEHREACIRLVAALHDGMALEMHAENVAWNSVGSIAHVRELLTEVVAFTQNVEPSEVEARIA